MRLTALPLLALLPLVSAQIAGIAGTIDNSAEASALQAAADAIEEGSYIFTNAKTGQALSYVRDGNHITPTASSSADASAVHILHHGGGVPWVRLQIGDKAKCLSSQWGGSYNLAGVMYACAVDQGGEVTRLGNTLEPTKQWWLLVPVEASYDSSSHGVAALVAAQKLSVSTREKANSKRHLQPFGSAHHGLVARQSSPRRKTWADRESSSSSSSSSQSVSKVSKTTKKKSSSKVKASAEKKQTSAAKHQSLAATSSSSSSKSADGQRYFIIPTDHLIDMHTLALTGHQIESAGNTQSTALDAWDASLEEQMWIISLA